WSDEPDVGAIHVNPLHPREPSGVALGIAQIGPQGAIGLARDREIEGEAVAEGRDRRAPRPHLVLTPCPPLRSGEGGRWAGRECHGGRGAPLDPVPVPERAFAVGEVEGKRGRTLAV